MNLISTYFTSLSEELNDHYTNVLLPLWYKTNSKYFDEITIFTNAPDRIPFSCTILERTKEHALLGVSNQNVNIMSTQIGCWQEYLYSYLKDNEVAIYLDPDAFMLNDKLIGCAQNTKHYKMTKKKTPYFEADAGISIFRRTPETLKYIDTIVEAYKENPFEKSIAEITHYKMHKGQSEYYIPWKDVTISLRGEASGDNIDCIHGCTESTRIDQSIKSAILKKELLRNLVY